jgi:hypothetical protein
MRFSRTPDQTWSAYVRQVIAFALGLALVIHAVVRTGANTAELITGLLLMGVVPVDAIVGRFRGGAGPNDQTGGG